MPTWIELDGLDNMRDLGGLPTTDGDVQPFRLLRSDNLQDLSPADVAHLIDLGLSDIVDLRSVVERTMTGPNPLPEITCHQHSFFLDEDPGSGEGLPGEVSSEQEPIHVELDNPVAASYASMTANRPDTMVNALRIIATAQGATLVHCAAGKDRTGIVCALALELAGVARDDVVADYVATTERIDKVVARMSVSPAYLDADDLKNYPPGSHDARAESIQGYLQWLDDQGGPVAFLAQHGWTDADTAALRSKLIDSTVQTAVA